MHLRRPPRGKSTGRTGKLPRKTLVDLLSFFSQIRPVGLSPKCLRTRGQLEHPTTSQGVILTRPRARVFQNPTSHRVGILPTGQFGPDLKIDAQNIDLRTVRPGTRRPVVLNPGIVHRTGLYPGTGHRVGPHPGRTVVRLDKGHRDVHHGAILGTGQFGTGLREGHPVLDLITDLIQGIVIRSVEGIDQEWRDTLDPDAINVITVRVQVLIRTRGLDQSARTGLPLLIDTGVIRRRRLTNVALLLSLETTRDGGTPLALAIRIVLELCLQARIEMIISPLAWTIMNLRVKAGLVHPIKPRLSWQGNI